MIVVSDASPVNHLTLVGQISILKELFGRIIIPEVVHRELTSERTPEVVREFISTRPEWIEIRTVDFLFDTELDVLDPGERDAIVLAEELKADYLLIDEKLGRSVAAERNLRMIGTLGIADRAAAEGLIDFPRTLSKLKANDFYVSADLEKFFLARDEARKRLNS